MLVVFLIKFALYSEFSTIQHIQAELIKRNNTKIIIFSFPCICIRENRIEMVIAGVRNRFQIFSSSSSNDINTKHD